MKLTKSGFTIVELLIVIVVISILAAVSLAAYGGVQERTNATKIASTANAYIKLLKMYKAQNGFFPGTSIGGAAPYNGTMCLGRPSEFPAAGNYLSGECFRFGNGWRGIASDAFMDKLTTFGTLPTSSSFKNYVSGEIEYRGIIYDTGGRTQPESVLVEWMVPGDRRSQCGPAAKSSDTRYYADSNDTRCSVWIW